MWDYSTVWDHFTPVWDHFTLWDHFTVWGHFPVRPERSEAESKDERCGIIFPFVLSVRSGVEGRDAAQW